MKKFILGLLLSANLFASSAGTFGNGTVSSVSLTAPAIFSVSGSPVTTTGTLGISLLTESANLVWAGPTSGSAATPGFRSLVTLDLPSFLRANSLTNSRALQTDGSGNLQSSSTTVTELSYVSGVSSAIQTQLNTKLASAGTGLVEEFTGHIIAPANYTYVIDQSAAYAYTINTLTAQTSSGTIQCLLAIGGTTVTGISALSISSSPATATASALNSVSIGNRVTMVCSSNSSGADLSFTTKVTRQ